MNLEIYILPLTFNLVQFEIPNSIEGFKAGAQTHEIFKKILNFLKNFKGFQQFILISLCIFCSGDFAPLDPGVEVLVDVLLCAGVPAKRNEVVYECCPEPYLDITFVIQIRDDVNDLSSY